MAKSKLGLGYSPLTEKIYLGHTNTKRPNEWVGEKRDITGDFIQVMLQKFEPDTESTITINGEPKYKVTVTTIEEEKNKMNCDCLTKLPPRMVERFNEDNTYKHKVLDVDIEKALIFGKQLTTRTYTVMEIELEGQKRKIKQNLMHSFCPFCGVKIVNETKKVEEKK